MPSRRDAVVGTIRPNRLARIELVQATVHTSVRAFERSVAHRRCATCPGGAPPVQPAFIGVSTLESGPRPQSKHESTQTSKLIWMRPIEAEAEAGDASNRSRYSRKSGSEHVATGALWPLVQPS